MKTFSAVLLCLSAMPFVYSGSGGENPVIAVVPNAWHTPAHWSLYTGYLTRAGYDVKSEKLESCNSLTPNLTSVQGDANAIKKNLLMPSINIGKEVVLVAHSYSGSPSATAAKGLSVIERRREGKDGGVLGLIFVAALTALDGQSLVNISGGTGPSPFVTDYHDGQLGAKANASERFFNNVKPQELVDFAVNELKNQSLNSILTPSGPPAWLDKEFDGRRAFAICDKDNAVQSKYQVLQVQATNVTWDVKHFDTDHSPFLSQPEELGNWTISEIARFKAAGSSASVQPPEGVVNLRLD